MSKSPATDARPPFPGMTFDVVAFGASAGGIEAMMRILPDLPPDFPAAIVLVQHLRPHARGHLPQVLGCRTSLPVHWARDGEALQPGAVFIAPPDHHLLVNPDGSLSLAKTPRVHSLRPSADVLFTSVASSFKGRAIAVVLSGGGKNG